MKLRRDRDFAARFSKKSHEGGGKPFSVSKALKFNRVAVQIVREFREKLAADRPGYGEALLSSYEGVAAALKELADYLLSGGGAIDPKTFDDLAWRFSIWHFAQFEPLADNLTYDEEDRLRAAMNSMREGWRLFCGVLRMRLKDSADAILLGESAALDCTDFIEDFFLGEIETELSDDYNLHSANLTTFLKRLGEELR